MSLTRRETILLVFGLVIAVFLLWLGIAGNQALTRAFGIAFIVASATVVIRPALRARRHRP